MGEIRIDGQGTGVRPLPPGGRRAFRLDYCCVLLVIYVGLVLTVVWGLHLDSLGILLDANMQFLDLKVLQEKPFESLLYLNSQPPLLNFIAWILGLIPGALYHNFIVLNAICMSLVGLLVYVFSCRFVPAFWAFVVALGYLISPAVLLNIAFPFYPCLTAFGYAILSLAFYLAPTHKRWGLVFLVSSIVYLALLRSSFSLVHALFFACAYIYLNRRRMKMKENFGIIFIVFVLASAVPFKNLLLYGFFSTSSWLPMNMAKAVAIPVPFGYYPTPESIRLKYPELKCRNVYGVQDSEDKKYGGFPNFNSCIFLEYVNIAKKGLADRYVLSTHLTQIGHNLAKYISPPDMYVGLTNRAELLAYSEFVDRYVFLSVVWPKTNSMRLGVLATVILGLLVCCRSKDIFLAFCLGLLAVHCVGHIVADGIESQRFVFDVEFVFFVVLAAVLGFFRNMFARRSARKSVPA